MNVNQAGAFVRSRDGLTSPNFPLYFNSICCETAYILLHGNQKYLICHIRSVTFDWCSAIFKVSIAFHLLNRAPN